MRLLLVFLTVLCLSCTICSCQNDVVSQNNGCDTCGIPLDTIQKIYPTLAQLNSSRFMRIQFFGDIHFVSFYDQFCGIFFDEKPKWDYTFGKLSTSSIGLKWEDISFLCWESWGTTNGSFHSDASSLDTFYAYREKSVHKGTDNDVNFGSFNISLEGRSIPYLKTVGDTLIYSLSGPELKQHLTKIILTGIGLDRSTDFHGSLYDSTNWESTANPPTLLISLYK